MSVKLDLKNKIINGAFDFWQRGDSFAAIANAAYCADRFFHGKAGTMVYTIAKNSDVPTNSFATSSLAMTITTAQSSLGVSDYSAIRQRIEGNVLKTFKNKKMALAFWVKSSIIGTYSISMFGETANKTLVIPYEISVANTWEKKVVRFSHDSNGAWLYDSGRGIDIAWIVSAGVDRILPANIWQSVATVAAAPGQVNSAATLGNVFKLTDIVLVEDNEGQTRQPEFMYAGRDYFEELLLCQRYYEKSYELDTAPSTATAVNELYFWGPTAVSTTAWFHWAAPKRVAPTMQFWSRNGVLGQWLDSALAARSVDGSVPRTTGFNVQVTPGAINRQLHGHFAADAEL